MNSYCEQILKGAVEVQAVSAMAMTTENPSEGGQFSLERRNGGRIPKCASFALCLQG
jgi:hypothetical protein